MASGGCPSPANARSACRSSPITVAACSECPCTSPIATRTWSRQLQRLVEVPADLGLVAGRDVPERHGQARHLGQGRGQQAALQGQGDQVLLGVRAQRLHGQRDGLDQLAQDLQSRPRPAGPRGRAPSPPAAGPAWSGRRHADVAAQGAVRDELQPLVPREHRDGRAGARRAEHPRGHGVGQRDRAAALPRLRTPGATPRSGGSGRRAAPGSARPGRRRSGAAPAAAARASPSKVSAALMSSVTLVSAASSAAVRSARCRAR